MTQVELKLMYRKVTDQTKMASNFAEATKDQPISKENCITMERLTRAAQASAQAVLSAAAGNDEPKTTRG